MDGRIGQTTDDAPCPKRLWVMTMLSDDEVVAPGVRLPQGLEFHLKRCPSCRALADDLLGVTALLAEAGAQEPTESLLRRAQRQTEAALRDGARLTGRVDVDAADDGSLVPARAGRWRRWGLPLAAAAMIAIAFGLFSIMHGPGDGDGGVLPDGVVQTTGEQSTGDAEKPQASLASDPMQSDRDPTAVPEAYRGDDCTGKDCVEKAFVPRRGRR